MTIVLAIDADAKNRELLDDRREFLDATAHMVANHRILVEGDKGSCECYLMAQHLRKGTPGGDLYMIAGRYRDEVARTPQGWRIASRVLTRVWIQGNRAVVTR